MLKTQVNAPSADQLLTEGDKVPEMCFGKEDVYELDGERWFVAEDGSVYPLDAQVEDATPEGAEAITE